MPFNMDRYHEHIASPESKMLTLYAFYRIMRPVLMIRIEMRPVRKGKPNPAYRTREHLTEAEVSKLLTALKQNRHGHRDWLIGLLIYRHGLRVSEACDLRWDDIDLTKRTIIVRRLKGSIDSSHYLERDELTGLKH
jgi:integrase